MRSYHPNIYTYVIIIIILSYVCGLFIAFGGRHQRRGESIYLPGDSNCHYSIEHTGNIFIYIYITSS